MSVIRCSLYGGGLRNNRCKIASTCGVVSISVNIRRDFLFITDSVLRRRNIGRTWSTASAILSTRVLVGLLGCVVSAGAFAEGVSSHVAGCQKGLSAICTASSVFTSRSFGSVGVFTLHDHFYDAHLCAHVCGDDVLDLTILIDLLGLADEEMLDPLLQPVLSSVQNGTLLEVMNEAVSRR